MPNQYFDWPAKLTSQRFVYADTVRSADVNAALDLVSAGFALMPTPAAINGAYPHYSADAGTVNAYVVTMSSQVTSYQPGLTVLFKAANSNTGASTVNVNGLGAKALVTPDGVSALVPGSILAGQIVEATYDGTSFQVKRSSVTFTNDPTAIQKQSYVAFTTGGTGGAYTLTPTPAASAYVANLSYFVNFAAASLANATLNISGLGATVNLVVQNPDGTYRNVIAGEIPAGHRSRITLVSAAQAWIEELPPPQLARGALFGLTLQTPGSSTQWTANAGMAADSTNTVMMSFAGMNKNTGVWAAGNNSGGMDTGSLVGNTWYHVYVIRRPDTGATDVIASASATAPALPSNYTQFRRIGALRLNGATNWIKFIQDGDYFQWDIAPLDVNVTSAGSLAVSRTLLVPSGVSVLAQVLVGVGSSGSGEYALLTDPAIADVAAGVANAHVACPPSANGISQAVVRTNTSSQIRSRCNVGGASEGLRISTIGWFDARGRNA